MNDPQLDIYYRVSERDDFVLLGTITPEIVRENVNLRKDMSEEGLEGGSVGLSEQLFHITKMPDGSSLPEFNEIQFKFVSKRGFSVMAAWYEYDYLSRNDLN